MSALEDLVPLAPAPRKRSAIACQMCRQRKVRCNVFMSGPPCINCQQDNLNCEVVTKRSIPQLNQRNVARGSHSGRLKVQKRQDESSLFRPDSSRATEPSPSASASWSTQTAAPTSELHHSTIESISPDAQTSSHTPDSRNDPSQLPADEERYKDNSADFVAAIVRDTPGNNIAPYYIGEKQGIAFLLDVCRPNIPSQGGHFLVPKAIINSRQPEDLAYLWAKGAFSVPTENVCESLIRCYFRYVHPLLPIIDANSFLTQYLNGGPKRISSLLLCSMFSVAANFVDRSITELAGYSSRKDMKRSMYQRAKALYDCDFEGDKIVLIQSVTLLAFWYSDTDDRTGSWHWIGVAVSLCQALGLHRKPDQSQINQHISDDQRRLWRRIWWTCVIRDRWISFIIGRPLRINLDDCDTPMPSVNDVLAEMPKIPYIEKDKFNVLDSPDIAQCWLNLVKLSIALGRILKINSKLNGIPLTQVEVERCEEELMDCAFNKPRNSERTQIVDFHLDQFQLHYESAVITLYRPYILDEVVNRAQATEEQVWSTPRQRVRNSSYNTHKILDHMVAMNMIRFFGPMTLTVLVPTMHIHLLSLRSPDPLTKQLGLHKLDFLMAIMAELGNTYWAADFIHKLFKEARDNLIKDNRSDLPRPNGQQTPISEEETSTTVYRDNIVPIDLNISNLFDLYDSSRSGEYASFATREPYNDLALNSVISAQDFGTFLWDTQPPESRLHALTFPSRGEKRHTNAAGHSEDGDSDGAIVFNPSGKKTGRIAGPPEFHNKEEERAYKKGRLALAFRIFAKLGFDEGVAGHITLRDPIQTDCFWVNPFGVCWNFMTASDLILVNPKGEVIDGGEITTLNTAAYMIHHAVHTARPDVNCVAHCHSLYGRAYCSLGRTLDMITQDSCAFYNDHVLYNSFKGVVLGDEEGIAIAEALGSAKAALLQNHGLLTCGETIEAAVFWFISLEKCCHAQLLADAAAAGRGDKTVKIHEADAEATSKVVGSPMAGYFSCKPAFDLIARESGDKYTK